MIEPTKVTVYGSAEGCDVQIADDPYVSSHHARVAEYPDGTYVEDLGSTNGTYWNGRKVWRERIRGSGELRVGRTTIAWNRPTEPEMTVVEDASVDVFAAMVSHHLPLNIIGDIPQCRCCNDPMVEVEPGKWMCQLGAAVQKMLAEAMGKLT